MSLSGNYVFFEASSPLKSVCQTEEQAPYDQFVEDTEALSPELNDKMLGYWDIVADRLFKIRHCMDIAGVERSLPMFEPKIDPGLLVRAAAAGVDIASALNDINAPV